MSEIHMMELAECMYVAYYESTPKQLKAGEYHIPFGDKFDRMEIGAIAEEDGIKLTSDGRISDSIFQQYSIKIATARCARVSYLNFEGKDDYEADLKLFKVLSESGHYSPFEHVARAMNEIEYEAYTHTYLKDGKKVVDKGWCRNFRGFIQLRNDID